MPFAELGLDMRMSYEDDYLGPPWRRPEAMLLIHGVAESSLAWHAWVGMRDIWMDYIKPVGLRLVLQVATLVWLVGCAGWALQVLWRL